MLFSYNNVSYLLCLFQLQIADSAMGRYCLFIVKFVFTVKENKKLFRKAAKNVCHNQLPLFIDITFTRILINHSLLNIAV